MDSQTRVCQNCRNSFEVEAQDFAFYEKMKVPPPTWCPDCRFQRRLSFCNERYLYKNNCALCGKGMIAMYPAGTKFPVYCLPCYRGDSWDPFSYGAEYDFNRPFFAQFKELKMKVPRAALIRQGEIEGSEYCNRASYNKNCYMLVRANYNENSFNSYNLWDSKDSADCFNVHKSELAYQCIDCIGCFGIQYSQECRQCRNSYFLYDCRNCSDCTGCVGLRNKQYCIWNEQLSKEEYEKKLAELRLDTVSGLRKAGERFKEISAGFIREFADFTNCVDSSGNWLTDCKEAKNAFQSRQMENGKNLLSILEAKDCMDYSYWGRATELVYETANCGYGCSNIRFVNESWDNCRSLTYADNCYSSSDIFGCVGMKNAQYCILNKQYSKEEYEGLIQKIISHMDEMPYTDAQGRIYKFGEYFPPDLSTSAYNTTAAYEHFPLTREEAISKGYFWAEPEGKDYQPSKLWNELPDNIKATDDSILKETILCEAWDKQGAKATEEHNCTKAFRITAEELGFYRRMNVPAPRQCLNTRHFERFKKRNPLKLWERQCQCLEDASRFKNSAEHFHGSSRCPNKFETSYAPGRPEIVYCAECYRSEVA